MNLAAVLLIVVYLSICVVVVGYWAFGTIGHQDKSIQDRLDSVVNVEDEDDDFEVGDLL